MNKPRYSFGNEPSGFSVLSGVRDSLQAAGLHCLAEEFLERASACASFDEMFEMAGDYVEIA